LPEYLFTIRSGGRTLEPPRAVPLDGDDAALAYACEMVRKLREGGGYDDPTLSIKVMDEYRPMVFSIPFLAGCA
jgi:hypothetical protein